MKMNYFWVAMAAGMMSLASCSNDETIAEEKWEDGEQVIMLDMQDTDILETRSRPLLSTENMGAEKVTDVKLLVFEISKTAPTVKTLVKEIDIDNWNNISEDYSWGRQYSYILSGDNRLPAGDYTIIAVGQDETTTTVAPYTWGTSSVSLPNLDITDNSTWNSATTPGQGFAQLIPNAVADNNPAEIFSGQSKPVTITSDGGAFTAEVLLKRQVAGVLGYFDRIPAYISNGAAETAVTNIRLVASQQNTKLDMTISLEIQDDDTDNVEPIECIVNGFEPATTAGAKYNSDVDAYELYNIDLTKWFTGYDSSTGWAAESYTEGSNGVKVLNASTWINALEATNAENVKVADAAVLAGKFVIPFNKYSVAGTEKETFELQLLAKDGTILKSWRVKLDTKSQNPELGDGAYVYNIYRNHLYQIGQRGDTDNPDNPGVGGDDPQPLDKITDQELVIKINDQWEFIHNMEIE